MSSPEVVAFSPPNRIKPHRHLTPDQHVLILRLHRMGHPQQAIAEVVGVHQSTVSRTLTAFDDTRFLAKALLHAAALPIAEVTMDGVITAAEMGKPQPGIRVLEDLGVLPRGNARAAGPCVEISLGAPGSPVGEDPFDDEVIDTSTVPLLAD